MDLLLFSFAECHLETCPAQKHHNGFKVYSSTFPPITKSLLYAKKFSFRIKKWKKQRNLCVSFFFKLYCSAPFGRQTQKKGYKKHKHVLSPGGSKWTMPHWLANAPNCKNVWKLLEFYFTNPNIAVLELIRWVLWISLKTSEDRKEKVFLQS